MNPAQDHGVSHPQRMICPMADEHDEFFTAVNQPQGKHHMSLEDRISENTEALRALTIALAANHVPAVGPNVAAGKPPAAAPKPPAATGGALDYEKDVKPLALRVAKEKGREKLIEILGEFKVAQANLLKAEQWGLFITACNKALA
jgi:hypothetical protein